MSLWVCFAHLGPPSWQDQGARTSRPSVRGCAFIKRYRNKVATSKLATLCLACFRLERPQGQGPTRRCLPFARKRFNGKELVLVRSNEQIYHSGRFAALVHHPQRWIVDPCVLPRAIGLEGRLERRIQRSYWCCAGCVKVELRSGRWWLGEQRN